MKKLLIALCGLLAACNSPAEKAGQNSVDRIVQASEKTLNSIQEDLNNLEDYSKWEKEMRVMLLKEGKSQLQAQKEIDSTAKKVYGTPLPAWLKRHMKVMDSIIKADYPK